ncbi:macoilin [Anopheles stephensi]|uniref:macoilin n=1 Tax=Anopheles stephensi TaxID=30069 RepID=UPI001658A445|nr:macoilin [Anopheles stephensi]XP_035898732.1 macoilin [Anopheles stephensi]XP_035898733.1 macoilin [Anopheles stephensi]XP_035898734.1 macoilin [Anopheles stephensi]XP_035898735.1 macoilin [Anopheles stephensi]XP_035898736.1 macoilin [Anopheles stephensi]XP_035898738.1 macoilin [Anopheles stephensi]XP_035898739.1 macoilin [Anopheles stephensi]XP_035898740.1 macoilin [Anopheles stephensi]
MKRRNADCGKIRRPIKKNKIAEQIGSNTLLYIKFLLLWASVITADFLLEFRFEFLWPFWLLLRSIYDSYKYKGLAFSVLFVCIAVTSDLVCLFFIPVQWLFFAASTYVWVQYVWHTDKGICLPTIILWILFVYLEAAIRWKDSRNIPHLNLCRPFAAHCIGYPVVTLGFGFKSYVGYRIRQRKQREVAKDNDFYMQLLQEALPKEESKALEPLPDGNESAAQKDLVPVAATSSNPNSLNNSSSSSGGAASNRSDTGQHNNHHHNHHNHNHHHHNHQQQQQQQHHSKSTQSYKSSSSSSAASTTHANGHVGSGSSPSASSSSAMNGSVNHSSHQQQGSSKHRKSLDKDSSASSNASSNSSSTFNAGSKMNGGGGGGGGGGGSYYFHQTATFQQIGNNSSSTSSSSSSTSSNSSSNSGSTTISTKESSIAVNRANDHNGTVHCNGSTVGKDAKECAASQGQTARKDCDREAKTGDNLAGSGSSNSTKHGSGQTTASSRSKSPTESTPPYSGALGNKSNAGKQNGHVTQYHQPELVQPPTASEAAATNTESKGGSGRSGRKNRFKKAAEQQQAHLSAIAKLCATLALASSVTTLTTTTATSTSGGGGDKGTTITSSTYTATGSAPSASVKDNHQQNGEQAKVLASTSNGSSADGGKPDCSVSSVNGTLKATQTATGSSCSASASESGPPAATVIVQKVCESCPRLEGDVKKLRAELSAHRQTENELRQKYDSNTSNLKACLQAKQKDYDELQTRYQEHCNQRQQERQNLQTVERRLGEERRHRQSLEAQLNNERKYRKQAEEKAARAECGEPCKMKKQQMELEMDKMQNELHSMEEAKLMAEKQARTYEQELRKMELQLRNRDAQQNTEVLMSALAAMQDKNATLEKSLSAETRFKLDLFSALGGTRREVEILTCSLRAKEEEILDLNAKIVQLLAVMPTENLCLTSHGGGTGSDGGASMMRLADAPQLLPQSMTSGHLNGIGPGSGTGGSGGGGVGAAGGGSGVGAGSQQQPSPMSHLVQNGPSFCSQLGSLGVLTSTMSALPSSSVLSGPHTSSAGNGTNGGQIVQMQGSNNGGANAGNCPSGLDPNATIYTPKNNGMVGGTEA